MTTHNLPVTRKWVELSRVTGTVPVPVTLAVAGRPETTTSAALRRRGAVSAASTTLPVQRRPHC